MRQLYSTLTLILLSLFFVQCQREISNVGSPDFPGQIATPDPITATVQGNVFDENGAPAAGVTVQVGSKSATTNAKGYFRILEAGLDKSSAVVTATKSGYFKAYRTFGATSGANHVEIKLVKRAQAGTVDAATGGEVALSNGTKIALPANGIVTASTSAAYTGQVRVYAAYIDPSAADIAQTVPGSFMANDKDGKRVVLTSYGMVAVELEGASGEKLQIKNGSTATLTTAIPAAAQASAPATIPLWSVDETTGVWKEEGVATKSGNVYVGQVSHFSFWNCDVSQNAVRISMTLKLPGGESLVHTQVRLKRNASTWGSTSYGYTDSSGQVNGYVPYNETLTLEVLDRCNQVIYSQNVGPFTQNTNLGVITVSASTTSTVTVKGKLLNCSSTAVSSGAAIISFGNYTRSVATNAAGEFQTTFLRCAGSPNNFEIVGIDYTTQQQSSSAASVTLVAPLTDAGNITACGTSASQFINYTIDGTAYSLISPADSLTGFTNGQGSTQNFTFISGFRMNATGGGINFSFQSATQTAGTYQLNDFSANNLRPDSLSARPSVTLTTFPTNSGGFYEGTISGSFTSGGVARNITGTFRVRRG